jgi:SagB-type dehydrogenase family enzyme
VTSPPGLVPVHTYHDGTKHHFHQYARSAGFLDWASQPNPFRSFGGAPVSPLYPDPAAPSIVHPQSPLTATVVGDVLRHSLGLSAWKQFHGSRWSLRVNPSSGNLHPTEAYVVAGPIAGLGQTPAVYHYAPDRHALERRCAFESTAWSGAVADPAAVWLIALSSIHWREAWKYGERAFRYCQHDMGHAVATVRIAAALVGWSAAMLPEWSHGDIAALTGIDRDEDYVDAEREDAGCVLLLSAPRASPVAARTPHVAPRTADVEFRTQLLTAVREGGWSGRASQLSEDHVQWTFIDEIARATEDPGRPLTSAPPVQLPDASMTPLPNPLFDRALVLQRRSAVSLDGRSSIDARSFFAILSRVMPTDGPPWDALWWDARIHLALFVHRVDQVDPGLYLLARSATAVDRLKSACRGTFLWERVSETLPLFRLARGDCRPLARRVSCDQEIAADGFFSLGMIADFDESLHTFGPAFYRHLFWESGVVGQVLYLEAEAAGARGTGIGCFFDDPVHDVLGITDHRFQSLYHFTIGVPVEDSRLTTEPGYEWEGGS